MINKLNILSKELNNLGLSAESKEIFSLAADEQLKLFEELEESDQIEQEDLTQEDRSDRFNLNYLDFAALLVPDYQIEPRKRIIDALLRGQPNRAKQEIINEVLSLSTDDAMFEAQTKNYRQVYPELNVVLPEYISPEQVRMPGLEPSVRFLPYPDMIEEEHAEAMQEAEDYRAKKEEKEKEFREEHDREPRAWEISGYGPTPLDPSRVQLDINLSPELYKKMEQDLLAAYRIAESKRKELIGLVEDALSNSPQAPLSPDPESFTKFEQYIEDLKYRIYYQSYRVLANSATYSIFGARTGNEDSYRVSTHSFFDNTDSTWYESPEELKNYLEQVPSLGAEAKARGRGWRWNPTLNLWFDQKMHNLEDYSDTLEKAIASYKRGFRFLKRLERDLDKEINNRLEVMGGTSIIKYIETYYKEDLDIIYQRVVNSLEKEADPATRDHYYSSNNHQGAFINSNSRYWGGGQDEVFEKKLSLFDISLLFHNKIKFYEVINNFATLVLSIINETKNNVKDKITDPVVQKVSASLSDIMVSEIIDLETEELYSPYTDRGYRESPETKMAISISEETTNKILQNFMNLTRGGNKDYSSIFSYLKWVIKDNEVRALVENNLKRSMVSNLILRLKPHPSSVGSAGRMWPFAHMISTVIAKMINNGKIIPKGKTQEDFERNLLLHSSLILEEARKDFSAESINISGSDILTRKLNIYSGAISGYSDLSRVSLQYKELIFIIKQAEYAQKSRSRSAAHYDELSANAAYDIPFLSGVSHTDEHRDPGSTNTTEMGSHYEARKKIQIDAELSDSYNSAKAAVFGALHLDSGRPLTTMLLSSIRRYLKHLHRESQRARSEIRNIVYIDLFNANNGDFDDGISLKSEDSFFRRNDLDFSDANNAIEKYFGIASISSIVPSHEEGWPSYEHLIEEVAHGFENRDDGGGRYVHDNRNSFNWSINSDDENAVRNIVDTLIYKINNFFESYTPYKIVDKEIFYEVGAIYKAPYFLAHREGGPQAVRQLLYDPAVSPNRPSTPELEQAREKIHTTERPIVLTEQEKHHLEAKWEDYDRYAKYMNNKMKLTHKALIPALKQLQSIIYTGYYSKLFQGRLETFGSVGPRAISRKYRTVGKSLNARNIPFGKMVGVWERDLVDTIPLLVNNSIFNEGDDSFEGSSSYHYRIKDEVKLFYSQARNQGLSSVSAPDAAAILICKRYNIEDINQFKRILNMCTELFEKIHRGDRNFGYDEFKRFIPMIFNNPKSVKGDVNRLYRLSSYAHNRGAALPDSFFRRMLSDPNFKDLNKNATVDRYFRMCALLTRFGGLAKIKREYGEIVKSMVASRLVSRGFYTRTRAAYRVCREGLRIRPNLEGLEGSELDSQMNVRRMMEEADKDLVAIEKYATFSEYNKRVIEKDQNLFRLDWTAKPKGFRFRVLKTFDPQHFNIGIETSCCQRIGGLGEGAAIDSYINPVAGVIVLEVHAEGKWNLATQSYFHYVPKDNSYILDNVESNYSWKGKVQEITGYSVEELYAMLAKKMEETHGIKYFLSGSGYSKLDGAKFKKHRLGWDPRNFSWDKKYTDWKSNSSIDLLEPKFKLPEIPKKKSRKADISNLYNIIKSGYLSY